MTKANETITIAQVIEFLAIPATISVPVSEESGLTTDIPVRDIVTRNPHMIRYGLLAGFQGKLANVSKGGLKVALGRPATDADLAAARDRIVTQAWMQGTWNLSGAGPRESLMGELREFYVAERIVADGTTAKAVDSKIKATVKAVFGEDEKASFGRFMDAVATMKVKADPKLDFVTTRDEIEAGLVERYRADKAAKAEAEAESPIEVSAESLGF